MKKFIIILVIIALISLAVYFIVKWNKNKNEKQSIETTDTKPTEKPIETPQLTEEEKLIILQNTELYAQPKS